MSDAWNESGPVTAWTEHDGPGPDLPAPPPRAMPWGIATGWIAVIVIGTAWGCPCAGDCPAIPTWADVINVSFGITVMTALVGLFLRARWGAWLSAAAALQAIPLSVNEYTHAAWWGVLLASTSVVFLIWSVVVVAWFGRYRARTIAVQAGGASAASVGVPPSALPHPAQRELDPAPVDEVTLDR